MDAIESGTPIAGAYATARMFGRMGDLPDVCSKKQLPGPSSKTGAVLPEESGGLRLLVVDDYAAAADSLGLLLSLWGSDVHICRNAEEALEAALRYRPDAALVDIMLPGMDGYQLARRLREHEELKDMVLIAVTGLGGQKHSRLAQEAGFKRHLLKPLVHGEIQEILAALTPKGDGG